MKRDQYSESIQDVTQGFLVKKKKMYFSEDLTKCKTKEKVYFLQVCRYKQVGRVS